MKDMKSEAKMKMLQELKKMTSGMMGGELKGKMDSMKKVTVAAPDSEGLKAGLDKAKAALPAIDKMAHEEAQDAGSDHDETDESLHEEQMESPEEEASEEMSPEEIQHQIKMLQAKLSSIKK